jgi:hypothetical protein
LYVTGLSHNYNQLWFTGRLTGNLYRVAFSGRSAAGHPTSATIEAMATLPNVGTDSQPQWPPATSFSTSPQVKVFCPAGDYQVYGYVTSQNTHDWRAFPPSGIPITNGVSVYDYAYDSANGMVCFGNFDVT